MEHILTDHVGRTIRHVQSFSANADETTDLEPVENMDDQVHVLRVVFPGLGSTQEKWIDVKVRLTVPWSADIIPVGIERYEGVPPKKFAAFLIAAGEVLQSCRTVICNYFDPHVLLA